MKIIRCPYQGFPRYIILDRPSIKMERKKIQRKIQTFQYPEEVLAEIAQIIANVAIFLETSLDRFQFKMGHPLPGFAQPDIKSTWHHVFAAVKMGVVWGREWLLARNTPARFWKTIRSSAGVIILIGSWGNISPYISILVWW